MGWPADALDTATTDEHASASRSEIDIIVERPMDTRAAIGEEIDMSTIAPETVNTSVPDKSPQFSYATIFPADVARALEAKPELTLLSAMSLEGAATEEKTEAKINIIDMDSDETCTLAKEPVQQMAQSSRSAETRMVVFQSLDPSVWMSTDHKQTVENITFEPKSEMTFTPLYQPANAERRMVVFQELDASRTKPAKDNKRLIKGKLEQK